MVLQEKIQQNRAAIFDWAVILISALLSFVFPTISDFIASPVFHEWMFGSLLIYTTGVALKHYPLSYRLSNLPQPTRAVPYLLFLIVGHWFIFFLVATLSEPVIRKIAGIGPIATEDMWSGWSVFICCVYASLITWMVYRSKIKNRKFEEKANGMRERQELLADLLITASVTVLTFLFWEKGVLAMLDRAKTDSISDIWFLFVFLTILFVFFYLPLRYLYFMEDRSGGRNRRRLMLIFGFMLIRAITRMLMV